MNRYIIPITRRMMPLLRSLGFSRDHLRRAFMAPEDTTKVHAVRCFNLVANGLSKRVSGMSPSEYDDYLSFALWCALSGPKDPV